MANLQGQVGDLNITLQITRKDTGKVDEVHLIGKVTEEQLKELIHGNDAQHGSPQRGD